MIARIDPAHAVALVAAGVAMGAGAALGAGCVASSTPSSGSAWSEPQPPQSSTASDPMVVIVDPNGTLNAQPGVGAGVFTEYRAGGHWHVWWICDTLRTGHSCPYEVTVSAATGAISNYLPDAPATTDALELMAPRKLVAITNTTAEADGITFDANAGSPITLDVALGGQPSVPFFFFVQNDEVNGDYKGTLTNPLVLEPSSP